MSNTYGENIKVTIFGQSHSAAIGMTMEGIPAGCSIDMEELNKFLARRAPGRNAFSTARKETDQPEFLCGLVGNTTCGTPITAIIRNNDTRSKDYSQLKYIPRPGHADYTAEVKYNGCQDHAGGGHFSGRMTAPLCIAGGICKQLLEKKGINVTARIASVGPFKDEGNFEEAAVNYFSCSDNNDRRSARTDEDETNCASRSGCSDRLKSRDGIVFPAEKEFPVMNDVCGSGIVLPAEKEFPVMDDECGKKMQEYILETKAEGDSVGGVVECVVTGLPAGIGDHIFGGMENRISQAVFGIPAVKGIEFGAGFESAKMCGSENNDEFYVEHPQNAHADGNPEQKSENTINAEKTEAVIKDDACTGDLTAQNKCRIKTKTNNCGGILGGITNGMPLTFRAAFKPTPSIYKPQQSVDLRTMENTTLQIEGRHDPCIVVRAVPVVEAAAAIAVFDALYGNSNKK